MLAQLLIFRIGHLRTRQLSAVFSGLALLLLCYDYQVGAVVMPQVQFESMTRVTCTQHHSKHIQNSLFGDPSAQQTLETLPESALDLRLLSVLWSKEPVSRSAMIEGPGHTINNYSLRVMIFDDVLIEQIEPDHVILKNHDRWEVLKLFKPYVFGSLKAF